MKKIYLFPFIIFAIFFFSTEVNAATTYTLKATNLKLKAEVQGSGHLTIPGYKAVETALDCLPGKDCSIKVPKGSYFDIKLVPDTSSIAQWNTSSSLCNNNSGDTICNIVDMNNDISLTYSFTKIPNGECGASNAGTFTNTNPPTTDLCTAGTPTTVTGDGPWTWQCLGGKGGSDSSCVAYATKMTTAVDGDCGFSNSQLLNSIPTMYLCNVGTPTEVTGKGPWDWKCLGSDGGSDTSCVAFLSTDSGSTPWVVPSSGVPDSSPNIGTTTGTTGIVKLMKSINKVIINPLIIFMFALALAYFLFGVMQFVINPANEEMKKTGKSHMMWGVIGMTIMISVFGIMQIILNTLGENHIKIDKIGNYEVQKFK